MSDFKVSNISSIVLFEAGQAQRKHFTKKQVSPQYLMSV